MIEKLNKHFLRNDKVEGYFKENIEWKSFSLELLKRIDFNDGNFFTLLPNSARLERVYILESGILPPNPSDESRAP